MDLGKWLRDRKKQLEGVQAQVNPFDNGKTYATTTRKPAVNPFQSNNVNARYGVLADKNRRDQFVQDNQPSYTTPIASFESLKQAPGRLGSNLINNPVTTKLADITGADRQKSVDNRNSSDYLKPNSVIENVVAAGSNLGRFNPINQLGEIGQYVDTATDKTFLKNQGNKIGKATKPLTKFGTPDQGSVWASENLDNRIARESGNFATMLGQTANYASPVAGPIAMGGTISSEANDIVQQARAKGQNELIANLKGLASGGVQAAVERYSSKLTTGLPGASQIGKLTTNRLAKVPASLIGGGLVEGAEEFTQGLTGNIARGNKWNEGLKDQTIAGAKGGVMLGGFFGGANALSNKSQGVQQEVEQQVEQQNPQLQQTGIPAQPGSIRERIQRAKENVKSNIVNSQLAQNEGGYVMNPFYKDGTLKPGLDKNKVFEGVDGKPRYEVSDEGAKINLQDSPSGRKSFYTTDQLKSGKDATLSQVLDHPKLYEQYPGLKDLRIQSIDFYKDARSQAAYDSSTKTLNVSNELLNNPQELKEAILHEVQHSIQDIEGFAKGGSIQGEDVAGYNNLAGEAEARAVANRMNMTDAERYKLSPLAKEAKKYKNAKDFVEAMSNRGSTVFKPGDPISGIEKTNLDDIKPTETGEKNSINSYDKSKTEPIKVDVNGGIRDGHNRYYAAKEQYEKDFDATFRGQMSEQDMIEKWGDINFPQVDTQTVHIQGLDETQALTDFYNNVAKPQSTFYDSLDVPKEDLIIRDGKGKAMSIDPLESLKQEARKYKSAEEFVKAKTNQYHGTLDEQFSLDPKSRLFLTGDTDSASTYAGRRYNQEPMGTVIGYHAKDGKTLDLNDASIREKYVREVLGQDKNLKLYYDKIPENIRKDYFDTLGWVMDEYKAGKIPKSELDYYTNAQKNFKNISSKDVYANWDKIIARAKRDGYDYIKHTTEDPSAEITFPETVSINPGKSLLDEKQLTDLYNQATKETKPPVGKAMSVDPKASVESKSDKGYKVNRPDLKGKLSAEDAMIQSGLDSGWGSLLGSGETDVAKLTPSEKAYLKKSAMGYMGAGDPVVIDRANYYVKSDTKPQASVESKLTPQEKQMADALGLDEKTAPLESLKAEARKEYDFFSNSKYFADNDNVIKTLAELNDKSTPTYQALDLLRQERGLGGVEKNLIDISKRTDATNKQTAQAKQVAKKDLDGFTDDKSSLQRGKIEKTLDSQIRYNGEVMSKRDYIRKLIDDGFVPDEKSSSIYSPNDRSNYQAVTKTEADYARHLYNQSTAPKTKGVAAKQSWYHGTNTKFDKFDQSKIGTTTDDGIFGRGFYFSNNKDFAAQAPRGGSRHVMEVKPKLDNPLDLSRFKTKKELADYLDMSESALYQQDVDGIIRPTYSQIRQFTSQAKEMGHDGVLVAHSKYGGKGDELVVFDADKIQVAPQPTKKTFKPLSTPEDNIPAIAKQVTKLTPEAYAETFGVSQEQAKKDISKLDTKRAESLSSVGMTEDQATKKLESNAPTMSPGNKKTKTLVDSMINDKKLTEAARIAQKEGKELNYFAKKDPNGRSVGVEEYNPSRQRIEAGFVVDNTTGKILGNHIKVDPSGIQVNVGGEIVNVEQIIGNPLDWKGNYEVSSTMERNIFKNAPTEEIAQKTYKFLIANKIKAESELKQDLEKTRKDLTARVKTVTDAKPKTVKSDDYKADIFDYIEDKKSQADIASKYGPKASAAITEYKKQTRQLYDTLLERVNKEFAKFGEKEIPKRKDYITHINELNQQPNFAGELMGQLQNSIMGEGNQTTRGQIPGSIAGRTETFAPRKRWNPFAQQRKGGEFTKDPFTVVDKYLEPTLYNIHMTESAVRARAVESAFRTADEIRQSDASKIKNELGTELAKYAKDSKNGRLVAGFQEYANALAGKTQRLDRQIIDMSQATNTALRGWQGLQRIGGRATILGNVNSMLMQPLNQISTLADTDISSYVKGIARSMGNSDASELSPFIKARETKAESSFKGIGEKFMDKLGVPMGAIELASVKLAWNAEYEQVLKEGLKGNDAVIEADRRTERVVAGRGIADKPEVYRSTALNGLFQYTLEVSAQNKKFFKDFTPTQKAKFVAGAFAANQLYGLVTGNEPLPDYLDAAIQSLKDWFGDDDETKGEKAVQTGQRFLSETVKFNPFVSSAANVLSKDTRKKIFGSESDLARYDGAPAPIGVIKNTIDAVSKASSGDMKGARDSALKNIPAGNQIRKTLQGKELIQDGAKVDKNGKKLYVAPENPLGKLQALLFGPSATKTAREYFDKGTNATGGGNATKKDASGKTIDDFKTIAEASFNDAKGREFIALENDEARKDFARQSPENKALYDQYKSMQKAFNGGDKLLPSGLDKNSEKILQKYDRLEPKAREDIFNRQNDAEYQYELAKYEKDKLEGTISQVDAIRKEKTLAKMQVGSKYEKGIRDVYSLTKNQIKDLVEGSPEGQAIYDKLVKYDQELYDAGLISYRKFKNGLGSGKGGRGGRGKKDTSLSDFYSLQSSTNKKLRQLLASSEFKGGAKSPGPKAKQAAQKKISVNMKA